MITRPRNLPQADPYFDSVVLLAPLSGEDGDTTSTDLSDSAHALTLNGTAALDADIRKYGFTSLLLDGNSDYLSMPDSNDLSFSSGDFTIEAHIRFNGSPGTSGHTIVAKWTVITEREWFFGYRTTENLEFVHSVNGTNGIVSISEAWSPSADTWYHVAVCRDGSNLRLFVDGAQLGSTDTTISTDTIINTDSPVYVGSFANDASPFLEFFDGNIENVRITKGIARYTTTFTPPERAHPDQPSIVPDIVESGLILHLDPANVACFGAAETSATNLISSESVTGANGTPGTGAHTPNTANFPAYSSLNGGIFNFAGGRGMNVEEDLGTHTEFTIDIWYYKLDDVFTNGTIYLTDGRNDSGSWFITNLFGSDANLSYTDRATYNFDAAYNRTNPDFIDRWQHLVLTSDATGSKMYIDGTERTLLSSLSLDEDLGVNFRIGTRYTTTGEWTGYMGPIKVYDRALTASEALQNFNANKSRFNGF